MHSHLQRNSAWPGPYRTQPQAARPENPLGAELLSVLGWCLSLGAIVGLCLGGVLLTTGPVPGYFQVGLAFMIMWALLGVAAGLIVAGLRFLLTD